LIIDCLYAKQRGVKVRVRQGYADLGRYIWRLSIASYCIETMPLLSKTIRSIVLEQWLSCKNNGFTVQTMAIVTKQWLYCLLFRLGCVRTINLLCDNNDSIVWEQ
jgi:hypothetical protein